jgi:hypothetical protein
MAISRARAKISSVPCDFGANVNTGCMFLVDSDKAVLSRITELRMCSLKAPDWRRPRLSRQRLFRISKWFARILIVVNQPRAWKLSEMDRTVSASNVSGDDQVPGHMGRSLHRRRKKR